MQKNKKQFILILAAALLLLMGYLTLYICHAWSPEKILKEYLARYQKKYPDITFSLKSYKSGFDGNYTIEIQDIVITNEENPILQISKAQIAVSLATLIKESGDIHVKLGRVYSYENSHIFLEKEVDQLVDDLSSQYEIISQADYWRHKSITATTTLTEVNLESDNDIPGNERVSFKADISYQSHTNLDFRLESEFDLAGLIKDKELRGKSYIKLAGFKYRGYHSKNDLLQVIKVDSYLKTTGDFNASLELNGEICDGKMRLSLNKNSLTLNDIDLGLKLQGINPADLKITPEIKISGGLGIKGDWAFSSSGAKSESRLEVIGKNLSLDENNVIKPIELDVSITDLIRYDFKFEAGNLEVDASNKSSFDFSNHESMVRLRSLENKKVNKSIWRGLFLKKYFTMQFLSQIELNKVDIDGHQLSGDIIWSQDNNHGQAQVLSIETKKGRLNGRRVMTKSTQDCLFKLNNFPMSTLSWLAPKSWAAAEGIVSGEVTCPNKDSFKVEVESSEIILPVFSINQPLKDSDVKMRYYKDDRFSSLKAIWDRGRVEKINFKNKVYEVEGKREGTLMVLSLAKKEIVYKEKNNKWEFQEVRK